MNLNITLRNRRISRVLLCPAVLPWGSTGQASGSEGIGAASCSPVVRKIKHANGEREKEGTKDTQRNVRDPGRDRGPSGIRSDPPAAVGDTWISGGGVGRQRRVPVNFLAVSVPWGRPGQCPCSLQVWAEAQDVCAPRAIGQKHICRKDRAHVAGPPACPPPVPPHHHSSVCPFLKDQRDGVRGEGVGGVGLPLGPPPAVLSPATRRLHVALPHGGLHFSKPLQVSKP